MESQLLLIASVCLIGSLSMLTFSGSVLVLEMRGRVDIDSALWVVARLLAPIGSLLGLMGFICSVVVMASRS